MIDQDLASILSQWLTAQLESVHTCIPASIVTYDGHKTRKATVQPCINLQSSSYLIPYGPVAGVPVLFPGTSRFSFVFDLEKGDTGLLLISEASMGNWLAGKGEIVDPEDASRFTLNDAIFVPGLFPFKTVPDHSAPDSGAFLAYNGTSIEFKKGGGLKIIGDTDIEGNMNVKGNVDATLEIASHTLVPANSVKLGTHIHGTGTGPSAPPTPGT